MIANSLPPDFSLCSYQFDLPEDRIAQVPAERRSGSRLMVLKKGGGTECSTFSNLLNYLPEKCLLVANNSRVVPARLTGQRQGGGRLEFLLLSPLPLLEANTLPPEPLFPGWRRARATGLLRPAKKVQPGDVVSFGENLALEVLEKGEFGQARVMLSWHGDLLYILEQHGALPLPPYIKRGEREADAGGNPGNPHERKLLPAQAAILDRDRYQTVYAKKEKTGSVAAPTAGLHFTPALCESLKESGRGWFELTLYVGYGTFSPVRCDDIREHDMHAEYVELCAETAAAVRQAKEEGRAVIAVGTTSCRALEAISMLQGQTGASLQEFSGWVNHFIYPGKPFNIIDGMITNFHLPGSSLLMLVSALAGREQVLEAYQEAIRQDFRFFSYGDSMLIL